MSIFAVICYCPRKMEGPLVGELGQTVLEFLETAGCLERLELARAQSGTELLSQPFLLEVSVSHGGQWTCVLNLWTLR